MDILDDFTGMPWAISLRSKEEAFPKLIAWQKAHENETSLTIGTYIFDNGELKSNKMSEWLQLQGTSLRLTAPYSSAQNGRVERLHRTLMAKARTMRLHCDCPPYLWDEFYMTATFLHSITTNSQDRV